MIRICLLFLVCLSCAHSKAVIESMNFSTVCHSGCDFVELPEAIQATRPRGTIFIKAEEFNTCGLIDKPLKIIGESIQGRRPHLKSVSCSGKGALMIAADDVEISNLEISDINVQDKNGACIRVLKQANRVRLRNIYCHDSQNGILARFGEGLLAVEDSVFERCGFGARAHGSYINTLGDVVLKNVDFLSSKGQGHSLKVSARSVLIEDSMIAALDGHNSRGVDLFGGGKLIIRNSIIQQGPNSENTDMIALAMEPSRQQKGEHSVLLENNWIIFDNKKRLLFFNKGKLFNGRKLGSIIVRNNKIIGMSKVNVDGVDFEGNEVYSTRADAGLVAYDGTLNSIPIRK